MSGLFWDDDYTTVYGPKIEFRDAGEFIKEAKKQYDGEGTIEIRDVKIEPCIISVEGLDAEVLIPIRLTDVVIENYYIGNVEIVFEK